MNRLTRYIENEFIRNSWFFAQAESSMMASIDFIDYVLKDENLINLSAEEEKYIDSIKKSYQNLKRLTSEIKEEIQKYKEAYCELFSDE